MATTEYKFVTFMQPLAVVLPRAIGQVQTASIDLLDNDELAAHIGGGWEPVSFQAIPVEGAIYLMIMLKATVTVPDHFTDPAGEVEPDA